MSLYGYSTSRDLSQLGSLLFMGLIGIVLAGLVIDPALIILNER